MATIVEIVGGLAILVDFKPRWAAGVLALWCLFTGFGFHLPTGDPENTTNFFKNLTMAAGFLYVVACGAGAMSVDASMSTGKA